MFARFLRDWNFLKWYFVFVMTVILFRHMKLTQQQQDMLWGEDGPYSQIHLIIETRILDNQITRTFVLVEVDINPFTFRYLRKHKSLFADDPRIQQLLDHADYRGKKFGYVSSAFMAELKGDNVFNEAQECVEYCKDTIIKMHSFVMNVIPNRKNNS